jgi:hypothetical protein
MKKTLLFLTAISIGFAGISQKNSPNLNKVASQKKSVSIKQPTTTHSSSVDGYIYGDTLYTNDFSVAGDFTLNPAASANGVWKLGDSATIGTGFFGSVWAPGEAFASTTAANGYAMFDSDGYGQVANNASITLGPISIPSTSADISVNFEQWYARFNDSAIVYISTNGTTFTAIGDNMDIPVFGAGSGEPTANPEVKSIDISGYAGQSVWFRFRYKGNYDYAWIIDDLTITEYTVPAVELDLVRVYRADNLIAYEQAIIPLSQADTISFGTVITNNGTEATAPSINYVIKKGGTTVKSGTVTNATINPLETDTSYYSTDYVPTATGTYTIEISLAVTDYIPENNSGTTSIQISDYTYSPTPADLTNATLRSLSNLDGSGTPYDFFKVGTRFEILENVTLYAINIAVPRPSVANSPIDLLIQIFDASTALEPNAASLAIGDYRLTNAHPQGPNYTTIKLDSPLDLEAGKIYLATVGYEADATKSLAFYAGELADVDDDNGTLAFGPFGAANAVDWFRGWSFSPAIQLSFDPTVGISETKTSADKLFVYPNPSSNQLNIKLGLAKASSVNYNLVDMNGRIVLSKTINTATLNFQDSVNLNEFANGIYSLQINTNNGSSNQKIVVAH